MSREPITVEVWGKPYQITPGVIDDAARVVFVSGQCYPLADAIRKKTGFELVWLGRRQCEYESDDEDCNTDFGHNGWCPCQVLHVAVVLPDGRLLDIEGVQSPARAVQEMARSQGDGPDDPDYGMHQLAGWQERIIRARWTHCRSDIADSFVDAVLALQYQDAAA